MPFRDIPKTEWRDVLHQIAQDRRAWPATVDRDGRVEVSDQPLRSISLENGVDLRLGQSVVHVDAPRALRIQETQEGAAEALQLYEGVGSTVTLRFRISERPAGAF